MAGKCKIDECGAPDIPCHIGNEFDKCPNYLTNKGQVTKKESANKGKKDSNVPWSGHALTLETLALVTNRSSPIFIGIAGKADAGKTSFIAMLYTLLLGGKNLNGYHFAGSRTIVGWDELHHKLKIKE